MLATPGTALGIPGAAPGTVPGGNPATTPGFTGVLLATPGTALGIPGGVKAVRSSSGLLMPAAVPGEVAASIDVGSFNLASVSACSLTNRSCTLACVLASLPPNFVPRSAYTALVSSSGLIPSLYTLFMIPEAPAPPC